MKNYITFINESVDNITVYYEDFCNKYFAGNKSKLIDWLNDSCTLKKIYYINVDGDISGNLYTTSRFILDNNRVRINMLDGQHGYGKGLVFIDPIILPGSKIKYVRKTNPELDPFEEDDWGFEEIESDDV